MVLKELAARLQQEEELIEDLDRKLAIEAQDEELARLLQEKVTKQFSDFGNILITVHQIELLSINLI